MFILNSPDYDYFFDLYHRKNYNDSNLYPIVFQATDVPYKVSVGYDKGENVHSCEINGKPFIEYPYQADIVPEGPQNINEGSIAINGVQIHNGKLWPYQETSFKEMTEKSEIKSATRTASLKDFSSSSTEVINSVIDQIFRSINDD